MSETTKTVPTWADLKAACDKDGKSLRKALPARWNHDSYTNGLPMSIDPEWSCSMALLDYLKDNDHKCGDALSQLIESFSAPEPVFETDDGTAGYIIFADDSLYFWNNSEDEVWFDYSAYIMESLDSNSWDELGKIDQALLLYYYDGNEEKAKERYS